MNFSIPACARFVVRSHIGELARNIDKKDMEAGTIADFFFFSQVESKREVKWIHEFSRNREPVKYFVTVI